MVFLPVKPLGHFEHDHEGKSKWVKYCRPEFDGVLFYDMKHKYCRPEFDGVLFYEMKQKYFVSIMKCFVVMDIYFFIYIVLGGETFILRSTYRIFSNLRRPLISADCHFFEI